MLAYSKLFKGALSAVLCGMLFTTELVLAGVIAHSEIHITNIQVTPESGSVIWGYNPGLNIASTSLFDDPSGFVSSYDDDSGGTGQASAGGTAAYGSASAFASSAQNKIDVVSDVSNSDAVYVPISNAAYGEVYNAFQLSGNDPVQVSFTVDWNALLTGQSDINAYASAYVLQVLVSDGINNYSREVLDVIPIKDIVNLSPGGTLAFQQTLQPNTLYSLDVLGKLELAQYVPEPSSLSLFLIAAFLARKFSRSKR